MSRDKDLRLALELQAQFDEEMVHEIAGSQDSTNAGLGTSTAGPALADFGGSSQRKESMSIVDEQWELLDPNPDMRAMFLEFNDKYFWGRLAGVEVRWSPRMTLCAGLCCYEGHGGLCSIRLSSPLLKLRPRKDLVETLLHEMIHAYLFVTANNKDHDSHGPEFCKHMKRLNQSTGTNITIYHNFQDEVDVYRQHWWRCSGPCQKRPPYYGVVRRAMNRAPSLRDPWWAEHQRTCGGSYTKVKEPEGYGVKKGTKRKKEEAVGDSSENETKKRATDAISSFPGKGIAIGGTSTSSRLIQPKTATLDKFLRRVGGPQASSQSSHPSSPSSSGQDIDEGAVPEKNDRTKSSRLQALAAIFDSDDDDDEDIVIVKFDKPLKKSNSASKGEDLKSRAGTFQSNHPVRTPGSSPPRSSGPVRPTAAAKPKQVVKSDDLSKQKGVIPSVSHQSKREDHGKKQDSIVDAFSRMRQRSGESRMVEEENQRNRYISFGSPSQHRDVSQPSRSDGTASGALSKEEQGQARNSNMPEVECPVCRIKVKQSQINQHLDQCLS